jgi:hypothetical protein
MDITPLTSAGGAESAPEPLEMAGEPTKSPRGLFNWPRNTPAYSWPVAEIANATLLRISGGASHPLDARYTARTQSTERAAAMYLSI